MSLLQDGGNNFLLNTFGFFFLVFGQILAGDALARFLNHVRVCSKARLGHDAPKRLKQRIGYMKSLLHYKLAEKIDIKNNFESAER